MKKYVCLKPGCRFVSESEYESEQHQKQGSDHDIFMVDRDYSGRVNDTDLNMDTDQN